MSLDKVVALLQVVFLDFGSCSQNEVVGQGA